MRGFDLSVTPRCKPLEPLSTMSALGGVWKGRPRGFPLLAEEGLATRCRLTQLFDKCYAPSLGHCFAIRLAFTCSRTGRQLNHRGALPNAQPSQKHHAAAWKLESVMMFVRVVQIDLAKPRQLFAQLLAASDLANRGSQLASSAKDQAKTLATELEGMARRNPLGALAGAVAIGVFIGMMGRRS
jgi:hypothetical protein